MTTGSSSLVRKSCFPPRIWILWLILLICSAGLSWFVRWWATILCCQCTVWVHQCEVVFVSLMKVFLMSNVSGKLCCSFTDRVLGNYWLKNFLLRWAYLACLLGSQSGSISVRQAVLLLHRQGSWKFPPTSTHHSRMFRPASQPETSAIMRPQPAWDLSQHENSAIMRSQPSWDFSHHETSASVRPQPSWDIPSSMATSFRLNTVAFHPEVLQHHLPHGHGVHQCLLEVNKPMKSNFSSFI
jgi:hypothetical protein